MNLTEQPRSIWAEAGDFWCQVFLAVQRIGAFVVFTVLHHYIGALLHWTLPDGWTNAQEFSEQLGFLFLMAAQLYLGYDMIAVFIPRLKEWEKS